MDKKLTNTLPAKLNRMTFQAECTELDSVKIFWTTR